MQLSSNRRVEELRKDSTGSMRRPCSRCRSEARFVSEIRGPLRDHAAIVVRSSAQSWLHSARVLWAPCEYEMQGVGSGSVFSALVTEGQRVDACEKMFTRAKDDRADGNVHLVDEPGLEVLANRRDAAAKANILTLGRVFRALQCGMDSLRDKVEGGAAVHDDG
jgi:hypothetical protein